MATKLIIVEGLPGSGKSTTAKMVYNNLKDSGMAAELFSEGDYNHPADYDGVAYFSNMDFEILRKNNFDNKNVIDDIKIKYLDGYLIPYRKAIEEKLISPEDKLFQDIVQKDVYELPLDLHMKLIFSRWKGFVDRAINEDKVIIFECCFIQNPVTVTMVRNNTLKEVTMNYINSLNQIIKPLDPILIYVDQKDIQLSFTKVVAERPSEWFEGFKYYYLSQGYGLNKGLKGLDGIIEILNARKVLEQEIYKSLQLKKYYIDNSEFRIDIQKDNINSILSGI
ncbi:MAG: hypothetical protein Q8936_13560 [Bacillota bacterium]|nr:hypothetical protein [Bacillota bacterium]